MYYKMLIINTLMLFVAHISGAQTNEAWISTGKVRARITPTGIHADKEGGFLVKNELPGQPDRNLLSHLTPWVGGLDPGNNLSIACEMEDPLISDWQAGFRGIPNSGKVWKVTIEQIEAHLNDYEDNGIIDHPIPEIFAWPAIGNPYSLEYNGFSLDSIHYAIGAPFWDSNWDGVYQPQLGDFPFKQEGVDPSFPPQIIIFSPFYDKPVHNLTHAHNTNLDLYTLAFTLDCQEQDFVENTIFFEYGGFLNAGFERIDSLYLGIFADFDIGNPEDDYLGCVSDPFHEMLFGYNEDTINDQLIGVNPPVVSINCLNYFLDANDYYQPLTNFIPIFPYNFPPPTRNPTLPIEYYNYLTGTWKDGTLLSKGGTGYNPGTDPPPASLAFPDNPLNPDGWSERAEGNPLGNRKCIISYGPAILKPNQHHQKLRFAITASDNGGLSQKLAHLTAMKNWHKEIEYGWDGDNLLDSICYSSVVIKEIKSKHVIAPNPAHDHCVIFAPDHEIVSVLMFNAMGQKAQLDSPSYFQPNEIQLFIKSLPDGVYFLTWFSKNGQQGCEKLIKQ